MRIAIVSSLIMTALATTGVAQAGMALGHYECWYFGEARMMLNFEVTSDSSYTNAYSGDAGTYALNGKNVTWGPGPMKEMMPDGFTAIYEVRNGTPTLAIISARGAEAEFCEKAK